MPTRRCDSITGFVYKYGRSCPLGANHRAGEKQDVLRRRRALLELRFIAQDLAHMNDLVRKNQQGLLNQAERQQLESYVKVGDILSLLHLKASKSLSR